MTLFEILLCCMLVVVVPDCFWFCNEVVLPFFLWYVESEVVLPDRWVGWLADVLSNQVLSMLDVALPPVILGDCNGDAAAVVLHG